MEITSYDGAFILKEFLKTTTESIDWICDIVDYVAVAATRLRQPAVKFK